MGLGLREMEDRWAGVTGGVSVGGVSPIFEDENVKGGTSIMWRRSSLTRTGSDASLCWLGSWGEVKLRFG